MFQIIGIVNKHFSMVIDKCVLFKIVQYNLSNANSIIRSCKTFSKWMYQNKGLMRIISIKYLTTIEFKTQFQLGRIFGPNRDYRFLKMIVSNNYSNNYSNNNYIEIKYNYINDIDNSINIGQMARYINNFAELLKQPSSSDGNDNLFLLYDQLKHQKKWFDQFNYSKYNYLYDIVSNYCYIVDNLIYMKKGFIRRVLDKMYTIPAAFNTASPGFIIGVVQFVQLIVAAQMVFIAYHMNI